MCMQYKPCGYDVVEDILGHSGGGRVSQNVSIIRTSANFGINMYFFITILLVSIDANFNKLLIFIEMNAYVVQLQLKIISEIDCGMSYAE